GSPSYWFVYDANGNVGQILAAADWSVAARYEYDPYGNVIGPDPDEDGDWMDDATAYALANPIRFSTKWFDPETGLGYWGERYCSPRLGRWMSRDPIEERGGVNLYAFVLNAPSIAIDATGEAIPVVAPVVVFAAACTLPFFVELRIEEAMGKWSNDKYAHCVMSCRIHKVCGPLLARAAGYSKELGDEIKKRLGDADDQAGWDPADVLANKDGYDCAALNGWRKLLIATGPGVLVYKVCIQESCHDCCVNRGHSPH
ncbi:MAG: RHS repeat domain-containing protein, partial [Armatimonadota bacterium]